MNDLKIQFYRKLMIILVFVFSLLVLLFLNKQYDSLARYPYQLDPKTKQLIKKHLSESEIEYIIEYAIEPSSFIDFMTDRNFSIYHLSRYQKLAENYFYEAKKDIVKMSESLKMLNDQQLYKYSLAYNYNDLKNWFIDQDKFYHHAQLIENPHDLNIELNSEYGISSFDRVELKTVDFITSLNNQTIKLRAQIYPHLKALCSDSKMNNCQEVILTKGHQTYNQVKHEFLNKQALDIYGHSYYQLGLAFKLNFTNKQAQKDFNAVCEAYGFKLFNPLNNEYRYILKGSR